MRCVAIGTLMIVLLVACEGRPDSACNADTECFVGQRCIEGTCVVAEGEGEGEGSASAEGEGEGVASGEGEGEGAGSFENWGLNEPNDANGGEHCLELRCDRGVVGLGTWNDTDCATTHAFVCSGAAPSTCAPIDGTDLFTCADAVDWQGAVDACATAGGALARIHDDAENRAICGSAPAPQVWAGASDLGGDWQWLDGTPIPHPFSNWNSNEPTSGEHCLELRLVASSGFATGDWNASVCSEADGLVCDVSSTPTTMPTDCTLDGGRAYCTTPVAFGQAEATCSGMGGTLARIDNQAENDDVTSKALAAFGGPLPPSVNGVWLGGSDQGHAGTWTWSDGTVFDVFP